MSSYLLASKFSFLANPLNTLFNSHSHAVGSSEEQVKLRSVRLSRSHVFPFLARCCDRILFCLSAFLFIMQSRQTLWFLTSQLCPSDLIYKHRLWQLRAAQGQTSSLTNTQVVILYLLFLINLQSNPLFSPRAGQRSGSLRHPRSFSGKRLKYLLTQELKLKRSAMLFFYEYLPAVISLSHECYPEMPPEPRWPPMSPKQRQSRATRLCYPGWSLTFRKQEEESDVWQTLKLDKETWMLGGFRGLKQIPMKVYLLKPSLIEENHL